MENLLWILLLCNNLATFDYQSFEFEGLVSDNSNHKWHIETRYLILNSKYAAFIWNSRCVVAKKRHQKCPSDFSDNHCWSTRNVFSKCAVKPTTFRRSETHHLRPSETLHLRAETPITDTPKEGLLPSGLWWRGAQFSTALCAKTELSQQVLDKNRKYCKPLSGFRKSC